MSSKNNAKLIWLEEGLKILEKNGPGMLSIDSLAAKTKKTKGSFYHHFKNRDDYIKKLLEHYEKMTTLELIQEASENNDPKTGLKKLTELSFRLSSKLELAIRAWALYDISVKQFQDRIDKRRLSFLEELYLKSGKSSRIAHILALRDYSIYIGLQQLRDNYINENFSETIKAVFNHNKL